jgi:hypothetical protein
VFKPWYWKREKEREREKSPGPDGFIVEFYQIMWRELTQFFLNYYKKLKRRELFQIDSVRPALPWYQNQTRHNKKRKETGQYPWVTEMQKNPAKY